VEVELTVSGGSVGAAILPVGDNAKFVGSEIAVGKGARRSIYLPVSAADHPDVLVMRNTATQATSFVVHSIRLIDKK
jgi:hypothetical protein